MILIDKPFVSHFLIDTIKRNNFQIIATQEAKKLIPNQSLNWISEQEAKKIIEKNPQLPIYTNSENTISWIDKNLKSSYLPSKIQLFKNKIAFRELLKESFPNFFFKGVKFNELNNLKTETLKFPFIIKPAIGFFSIGVYKVDTPSEWSGILQKLKNEVIKSSKMYPKEVINFTDFIIEDCIEGNEYAVDCYFDNLGKPVVLNILHHIFSSGKDVSDRVYSTSKEILEKNIENIEKFLKIVGKKANLKNFPIHVEIRINSEGKIIPIELNPLRFGGWCTTGDLAWYAYGINSYEYFFKGLKPNWKDILKTKENKIYSIVALDNNSGLKESEIDYFDYKLLLKDFENPLSLRKVDFKEYPIFGILFTETTIGNEKELTKILISNLQKYIKLKTITRR